MGHNDQTLDPASVFQKFDYDSFSVGSKTELDEEELIKAARQEIRNRKLQARLTPAHKLKIADELYNETPDFSIRFAEVMQKRPGGFPTVELEYQDIQLHADALVGKGSTPTVWNAAKSFFFSILLQSGLKTKPVKILDGVSGVIKPGRVTLVLGPPGAGKSVFLQLLSGRLRTHKHLRMQGSVKYNGVNINDFVVRRTAGLVDQYDRHIPDLTVLETVQFASKCQRTFEDQAKSLAAVDLAAAESRLTSRMQSIKRSGQPSGNNNGNKEAEMAVELMQYGTAMSTVTSHAEEGLPLYVDAAHSMNDIEESIVGGDSAACSEGSGSGTAAVSPAHLPGDASFTVHPSPFSMDATHHHQGNGADDEHQHSLSTENHFGTTLPRRDSSRGTTQSELEDQTQKEFYELLREAVVFRVRPHVILQLLGLAHVANTFVGNELLRGISGGERKRVTTAEILAGPQWALFMDEISTGLDSATTYSVIKSMKETAHALQRTTVISLLQPAPEVMNLFDDLLLMVDGKVIFHGPMEEAVPFFASLGFDCPPRKDPASFLQEVTTPLGQITYATEALLKKANVSKAMQDPSELLSQPPKELIVPIDNIVSAFWTTPWGEAMREQLEEHPFDPENGSPEALARKHFARSAWSLSLLAFKRQLLLASRDKVYYIVRVIQACIMGLIISSFFASVAPGDNPNEYFSQGRKVLSLCVISTIYMSLSSMPQIGFVFNAKAVFFKQRDNHFFPPVAYVISHVFTQLFPSTVESILFSVLIYFISGLTRTASNFFIFLLVMWSSSNCFAGLFRFIAYFAPSMVVANALGALLLLLLMLTNGYTIIRTSIPGYLIWIYWAFNPLAYTVRALAINDLVSPEWSPIGTQILQSFGFFSEIYWIWIGVAYLWGYLVFITALSAVVLHFNNPATPSPVLGEEEHKREVQEELKSYIARLQLLKEFNLKNLHSMLSAASFMRGRRLSGDARVLKSIPENEDGASSAERDEKELQVLNGNNGHRTSVVDFNEIERSRSTMDAQSNGQKGTDRTVSGSKTGSVCKRTVAFTPITLVCRDIRYYVNDPSGGAAAGGIKNSDDREVAGKLQLLKSIDFYARPGELTALMGGSGAGKTTLMDVVCGRKTQGIIRGDIIVNGRPKEQGSWSRVVGYVEQMDIHSSRITVKESLYFSARLRLDEREIDNATVVELVEDTLSIVELDSLAHSIVGDPGVDGLSIEQRKRLSIAVEMVTNPSVLFMDEPTSGLDARAAAIVMRAVRNVANSNRTVVVTIHQPSMDIFEAFDRLVLLQRGGRLTYFGPLGLESSQLIKYLESFHDVVPIKPGYNPATWMLEVTGGSMATTFKASSLDFPQAYLDSQLRQDNLAKMDQLAEISAREAPPVAVSRKYAASSWTQALECTKKYIMYYWRAPNYNFIRILITTSIALIYGLTYLNEAKPLAAGSTNPVGISTVQNIMGLLFSMAIFNGMFNCMTVMPLISSERAVFYREQAASMYAPQMAGLGQGVAELPYLFVQAVVMVCISYWMVGFQAVAWKFFYFLLMFFLTITMYTFLGQALVIATPNPLIAQLLAAFLNQIWTLANGFLVPYPNTPAAYQWLARASPTTWILYGLGSSQLADSDVPFQPVPGSPSIATVGVFVQSFFGYDPGLVWWCALILTAYVLFFRVLSSIFLSYVNYNRR